ncbi:hypothetical protein IG193_01635 [Infirmifilum lucidum]|uniref:Aspartyl protease n=1 Tax=Infirmifilum lucidum TaxID=2776706 RepID=A0A7L9FHE2_9CREN|nr:hypothetical protein [Infirmifilum lucidum]QOJ79189.1 hypothetical protein IG193_01635 [Infirmifilum lucidum]
MESGRTVRGWYSDRERPPVPCIRLKVYTPSERYLAEIDANVDTGFSGSLLISPDLYIKLGLALYEEPEVVRGSVAGGYFIDLRVSNGIVELNGLRTACKIYTALLAKKNLVGRALLNRFRLVLDGKSGVVEVEL